MTSVVQKATTANSLQMQRMQTLIIGRLLAIFLLLVASWFWYSGTFKLAAATFPQGLFLVFLISVGLTVVYFFLLRLNSNLERQIRAQFILDALLITWLVWQTGDISSPYIMLYIVLVSVASFFLKPLATMLMSVLCCFLFVALAILAELGVMERLGIAQSPGKVVQIVSFNVVAILVVGLLSARLSERHFSGAQLAETTKTLAKLRAVHERIVESIRSGLVTTDLDGKIYTFNAAATEITGYLLEQVQSRPISELFGDIQEQIDLSLEAAGNGEPLPRFETDLITPEGFAVRVGFSVTILLSENNEASGLIITFQDLTEVRSMEENIRRKDRLAAVGRVAAGLAHEIRNPLGAMRGAIQVLESSVPPDSVQTGLMDIVLKESDRLNRIITNFLSYARPANAEFAEVDVCKTIAETLTLLKHGPDVREKHVISFDEGCEPLIISADAAQLKQIFWNLSRNALQAMPDGGELRVGTEKIPNQKVRITFTDSGKGMSREQVEQLFEPFSNSTSGGTGLGLSIVYQIVKDHNGAINVKSTESKGTTITVELPRENRRVAGETDRRNADRDGSRLSSFLRVEERNGSGSSR